MDTETKTARRKPGPTKGVKYGYNQKTARLEFPLEPAMLEQIRAAADKEGVSVSKWMRNIAALALAQKEVS